MQKLLLIVALLGGVSAQKLTPSEASKLQNYNHSLSGKIRFKRLLQRTAKISKDKALAMAEEECKSEVYFSKLQVKSNRLFYTLKTDNGTLKIDALDGQIMEGCVEK